jgi:hypothetical protein
LRTEEIPFLKGEDSFLRGCELLEDQGQRPVGWAVNELVGFDKECILDDVLKCG